MTESECLGVVAVLALTLLASGCSDLATERDIQQHTREVKDHVSDEVEEGNSPVKKYRIQSISSELTCYERSSDGAFPENMSRHHPELFEQQDDLQTFNGGKIVVVNGISEAEGFFQCPGDREIGEISVDTVDYNESIYSSGKLVATNNASCSLYSSIRIGGDDADSLYEVEEKLREIADRIYKKCFGVKSGIEFDEGENW